MTFALALMVCLGPLTDCEIWLSPDRYASRAECIEHATEMREAIGIDRARRAECWEIVK